jgi:flagellar basal-body rod modification protein FlgD
MATSPISSLTNTQSSTNSSSSTGSGSITGISANEGTFLTLLVTQLKNQDPLNPTDSTQFVSELAQFSSLEQLININQGVTNITSVVDPAASTSSTSSGTTSSSGTSSNSSSTSGIDNTLDNSLLNSIG